MTPHATFMNSPQPATRSPSNVKYASLDVAITRKPQSSSGPIAPSPRRGGVTKSTTRYGRLHLLRLPCEVRLMIWRAVHYDILLGSEESWFNHPLTAWDGLQLTCRQIRIEIDNLWPCAMLPQAIVHTAFTQTLSIEVLTNFRRLSLELPFDMGQNFYDRLAQSLVGLAPVLEDLRLFFVGKDKFNVESFVHGCGLREPSTETSRTRLVMDGQHKQERKSLFMALYFLQRLRTLVIKNANFPLLQSLIIKGKPQLQNLHLSTDPRACLHTNVDLEKHQHLITPPKDNFPPVKKLHISTNAALTALQVAAKVASTLEELNWTVTDSSLQHYSWPWLQQTAALLDHLGMFAKRLRILRLCFHAPLYEGHHAEAAVIGDLKQDLPRLTSLETLELHIHSKADFSGAEIIFAIPDSLRRLYVSDKLISAKKLEQLITRRYLWSKSLIDRSPPRPQTLIIDDSFGGPQDASRTIQVFPPRQYRKYSGKTRTELDQDYIVGETRKRIDHVPFRHGRLGFIAYEYEGHKECCACGACDEAKLIMLRLNGRLLDRERNCHLAAMFDGGSQIWPRINFADVESDAKVQGAGGNLDMEGGEEKLREQEELTRLTEKWDADPENDFGGYFGMEDRAAGLFAKEIAVTGEELPERKWADDAAVGPKEHWLSAV